MIDFQLIRASFPALLSGALMSLKITGVALTIGIIFGTILGVVHSRAHWLLRFLINVYVTIIRGTPMIIQITFFYYVLPEIGWTLSNVATAMIAIGINSSVYLSQIIRSGIESIGKDQGEAAQVLGFTKIQTIRYIILPQAVSRVLPALISEGTTLIKDSSLASVIGVTELYKEAKSIISQTYDVTTIFFVVACFYLVLTGILNVLATCLEKKWKYHA